uniref:Uncharacterized protein n=1 Tax=Spongospora subterranea TaxID=70186 RepID=A0A0H5QXC5_9EUKA|eukprot:CRZ06271.1 hypothetical protein [Spongospora subterranea]
MCCCKQLVHVLCISHDRRNRVLLGCVSWSAFPEGFFSNQLEVLPFLTCRIHADVYYMFLMSRSRNGSKNGQFSNLLVNNPTFLFSSYLILLHPSQDLRCLYSSPLKQNC